MVDLWAATHRARQELADDLARLGRHDWRRQSLCGQWDVEHVVAHLTAVASVGSAAWMRSIVLAGFRPSVHNERRLQEHLDSTPEETLAGFRAVIDSTVAPSKDVAAYLGEVIVHSEDIRHPLGIERSIDVPAATAVLEFYVSRNFTVQSKTTAAGLRLRATDGPFESGQGATVTGPTSALLMTMAGRRSHLDELAGSGVDQLAERLA